MTNPTHRKRAAAHARIDQAFRAHGLRLDPDDTLTRLARTALHGLLVGSDGLADRLLAAPTVDDEFPHTVTTALLLAANAETLLKARAIAEPARKDPFDFDPNDFVVDDDD